MFRQTGLVWGMTLLFALITGYVNVNSGEVMPPLACILLFSFILGLPRTKRPWLRALVIGLSIPLSYFVVFAFNLKPVDPPHLPATTTVLVIPALIATYAGVLLSQGIAPLRHPTS